MSEVTPDCLDAETLAAWMDDGLPAAALAAARAHVAGCARCQALVATMVRIEPPAAAAAAARPSRGWMTWLLPVAGAAAALTWFVVAQRTPPAPVFEEQSKHAAAPAPTTPVPPPAAAELAPKTLADEAPKRDAAALSKERRQNADAKNELNARSREDKDAKKKTEVAAAPPTAAAPPPAAAANAAGVRQESLKSAQAFDRVSQVIEVRSPNPAVRWRMSAGGVEKTIDGGATWSAQQLPVSAPLVAGVSPARNVCWLVGANGVVLLTTDGQIWRRLAFPELTPLVAVTATDAISATVKTADGRDFVTKDAGITWIQRQLQDF